MGSFTPSLKLPFAAQAIEHARNGAGVLAELGGFAFEAVNFLDDFDGNQDVVFLEVEERVGIVEENVGVKNVIFHWSRRELHRFNFRHARHTIRSAACARAGKL